MSCIAYANDKYIIPLPLPPKAEQWPGSTVHIGPLCIGGDEVLEDLTAPREVTNGPWNYIASGPRDHSWDEGKTNEVGMNTVACPDTQQPPSFPFQDDE